MNNDQNFSNYFLIAMPSLTDPLFHKAVVYICEHNQNGAMGIVINRSSGICLGEVLQQLDLATEDPAILKQLVLTGGPIQRERGFVIHRTEGHWDSSLIVNSEISITTSKDVLKAMADHKGPPQAYVALGYAGWRPGQLEQEISQNSWLVCEADPEVIFNTPIEDRWRVSALLLGVDVLKLTSAVGHA